MKYLRDEDFLKAFGKHLKKIRNSKKITQAELAFTCEMEISQISRMERGLINTSISNLFLIAQVLNIHPRKLLDFEIV